MDLALRPSSRCLSPAAARLILLATALVAAPVTAGVTGAGGVVASEQLLRTCVATFAGIFAEVEIVALALRMGGNASRAADRGSVSDGIGAASPRDLARVELGAATKPMVWIGETTSPDGVARLPQEAQAARLDLLLLHASPSALQRSRCGAGAEAAAAAEAAEAPASRQLRPVSFTLRESSGGRALSYPGRLVTSLRPCSHLA